MKQASGTCKKQIIALPKIKLTTKPISLAVPKINVQAKQKEPQ